MKLKVPPFKVQQHRPAGGLGLLIPWVTQYAVKVIHSAIPSVILRSDHLDCELLRYQGWAGSAL